jgi:hypothetical protein
LRVGVPFEKQNDILQQMEPEGSEIRFVQHLFLARLQGDQNMRRNSLILGTTFLTIGFATAAAALPAGPPSGLKAAIEEQSSVDTVIADPAGCIGTAGGGEPDAEVTRAITRATIQVISPTIQATTTRVITHSRGSVSLSDRVTAMAAVTAVGK